MSNKKRRELAGEMHKILGSLDRRWIQAASREICANLSRLIDREIGRAVTDVLAWVPHFNGEVDLAPLIDEQVTMRRVFLPRLMEDRSIRFIKIGSDWKERMQAGLGGIPAPRLEGAQWYDGLYAATTVAFVPGFAFDSMGNRLGRDFGCYGRFFRGGMLDAIKVGTCWSLQLLNEIPEDQNEVLMDWVCHERASVRTGVQFDDDE